MAIRGTDKFGSGYYGAPRGNHKHNGVDIITTTADKFRTLNDGRISKLGYPYKDDLGYRYVQVTDKDGSAWRYFYVHPTVKVGDEVKKGDVIGLCQDLDKRYKGITQHVHFEIMRSGDYIDPTKYVS